MRCAQTLLGVLGPSFLKILNSGKGKKAKYSDLRVLVKIVQTIVKGYETSYCKSF